jgi:hypothetical protein
LKIYEHFLAEVCDKCPYLDLQVTDDCLYSNDEIYARHIKVTCSNVKACARASRMGMDNMVNIMKGDKNENTLE